MLQRYYSWQCLPSSAELLDSDETPVDNELQNLVPNLLGAILAILWAQREDWFFGVDMGVYYDPEKPAVVPDGFLSLGVERFVAENGRLSYVLWEEDNVLPILALEVVSKTYRGEYGSKMKNYARLEILYYVVYNPSRPSRRRKHDTLEVYKLVDGEYVRLPGEPVWLAEIGLGIGRSPGRYCGWQREWLYWFDATGNRLAAPEEQLAQVEVQVAQERSARLEAERRAERLAELLRERGIDPEALL
ncbi:Uma2 family endonuclease [Gloeobacter violaceus]|uniref:Gll1907 protein n=1 Tax=Gloeobacter violaceus (strain ATCC 29082 / PCC 7421) TaxID=251221 RepID=Q7NJC5_GLOVI|nr:Uma2 family endonuclease [Gloeobacter violaceus]BAC89848.1 gll1907 [Gloeobacter violaceus PCC 7421]